MYAVLPDADLRLREIAELQQRAESLARAARARTSAEQTLARRERELADFVDNADGLHRVGPDGIIVWANQALLDLLGYARDEYIGCPITGFLVDPKVGEEIQERLVDGEAF